MSVALAVGCTAAIVAGEHWLRLFAAVAAAGGLGVAAILQIREWLSGSLVGAELRDDLRHPVVPRHKIRDLGGLLFVAASITAVVVGTRTVGYFFAIAIGAGIVVAAVMHRAHG